MIIAGSVAAILIPGSAANPICDKVLLASWETKGFYEPPSYENEVAERRRPRPSALQSVRAIRFLPPDNSADNRFSFSGNRAGETGGFRAPLIARGKSIAVCARARARRASLSIVTRKSHRRALFRPPNDALLFGSYDELRAETPARIRVKVIRQIGRLCTTIP